MFRRRGDCLNLRSRYATSLYKCLIRIILIIIINKWLNNNGLHKNQNQNLWTDTTLSIFPPPRIFPNAIHPLWTIAQLISIFGSIFSFVHFINGVKTLLMQSYGWKLPLHSSLFFLELVIISFISFCLIHCTKRKNTSFCTIIYR